MHRENVEKIAGTLFLAAFIAAQFFFGIATAVKVLGIACIFSGALWSIGKSVPVGIEGRPPSFFLRGTGAVLTGVVMVALGIAMLFFSRQVACELGWAASSSCA